MTTCCTKDFWYVAIDGQRLRGKSVTPTPLPEREKTSKSHARLKYQQIWRLVHINAEKCGDKKGKKPIKKAYIARFII
jgi:hypothetical protein